MGTSKDTHRVAANGMLDADVNRQAEHVDLQLQLIPQVSNLRHQAPYAYHALHRTAGTHHDTSVENK